MQVIEVRVAAGKFGEILGKMRGWLDHNESGPVRFETKTEAPGLIYIRVGFDHNDRAEAFRQEFTPIRVSKAGHFLRVRSDVDLGRASTIGPIF
jgi:hypothetical protein